MSKNVSARRHGQMSSNCIRSGRQPKNGSQLKLHLSHGKMECKHGSNYVQDNIDFAYRDPLLTELNIS
jgi:hypothetical protein